MRVFEHGQYKDVLKTQIKAHAKTYGYRSKLAQAMGCQRSYLSQVLNSPVNLTLEHALNLARFWNLNDSEKEYFLTLVNIARSGTRELKEHFEAHSHRLKKTAENLGKRFEQTDISPESEATVYYSAWQFSAIHIILTIPAYRTARAIAQRLNVPETFVEATLKTLQRLKLVTKNGDGWSATHKSIHVPSDSFLSPLHHSNWKQRALEDSFKRNDQSIHYSTVYSLSLKDVEKLRQITFDFIEETRNLVVPSREEELVCLICDLFAV